MHEQLHTEQWQIDGNAPEAYERYLVPAFFARWAQQLVDAADLPYPDESFDVVFCQHAMQFFPDTSAALHEMHRVLVPNGRLGLNVLRSMERNPAYISLSNALERFAGARHRVRRMQNRSER